MKSNMEYVVADMLFEMQREWDLQESLLKQGVPLITKTSSKYSNAVVYTVNKGDKRTVVTVVSDYGNKITFPSVEDLFTHYVVAPFYISTLKDARKMGIEDYIVDTQFCLRDRLERQIELLTEALEGLNNGNA